MEILQYQKIFTKKLTKKITIKADKFSATALEKINKAGAKAETLE